MSGARQRLNKAVRQMPGGNETLDAIELFSGISQRKSGEAGEIARLALDRLDQIANAMRSAALSEPASRE